MRSSNPEPSARGLRVLLLPFGGGMARLALWVAYVAIGVLICTGEALHWVDPRVIPVSIAMIRAVHLLAGFALVAALLLRAGTGLLGFAERLLRRQEAGMGRPEAHRSDSPPFLWLLDAAWWIVVGLLVLSGLERYAVLMHGVNVLPWLDPAAWWALHRPLVPYLLAVLLLNGLFRGKMALKRALAYLYTP